MEKSLEPGKTLTVGHLNDYHSLDIAGLQVTKATFGDTLNMTGYVYDGMKITIKFAQNGYRAEVSVSDGKAQIYSSKEGNRTIQHGVTPVSNSGEPVVRTVIVTGAFNIRFRTDCGEQSADKNVDIRIVPDHPSEKAEVSYTAS